MKNTKKAIFQYAFKKSVPVMCGYLFLGLAFGILLQQAGYSALWAFFASLFIYAGSMEFVLVTLLTAGTSLAGSAVMTLFVNCRHMFYGLSFVDTFKKMGKRCFYMIFSLTDETYSVLCSCRQERVEGDPDHQAWFWIALLDHSYWIIGSVLGALAGQLIPLDFTGVDFSMTALFTVILIDQVRDRKTGARIPALMGGLAAVLCLFLFGTDAFLLPTLLLTVAAIAAMNITADRRGGQDPSDEQEPQVEQELQVEQEPQEEQWLRVEQRSQDEQWPRVEQRPQVAQRPQADQKGGAAS